MNFYHVLDPISGALKHPTFCRGQPPQNYHLRSGFIPGLAHLAYWQDATALRYILGRTYGPEYLRDQPFDPWSPAVLTALAVAAYLTWAPLLYLVAFGIVRWGPHAVFKVFVRWVVG